MKHLCLVALFGGLLVFPPFCWAAEVSDRFGLVDCSGRDVNRIYNDAVLLAGNAISWISVLLADTSIAEDSQTWKVAKAADLMFGAKIEKRAPLIGPLELTTEGKRRLTSVRDDYTRILNSLNDGTDMPADKNYILCGTDLTFTRNLRDIGRVDGSDSDFQSLYGAGVWYAKNSKNKNGVPQVIFTGRPPQSPDPQKPGVGHGICIDPVTQKKVVAQTFQPSSPEIANEGIDLGIYKIVLCDAIWDLREDIIADFGKDAGERTPGTSANADDIANRGGYLLHEMFHLLDRSTASTKKDWRDKDTKIRDQETPDAYKMTGSISLTKTGDWQRIGTNPDNYRVFADMAWWSKTRWRGLTPVGQSKRPAEDISEDDLFESPSDESDSDSTDG